jgi:hypothetical protein
MFSFAPGEMMASSSGSKRTTLNGRAAGAVYADSGVQDANTPMIAKQVYLTPFIAHLS